ncbi:bifunctional nuclease family protein [Gracilimonas amylolytica]|uniref:bifunctional nuclease family protein n=1 Tax=Gracilimonas amylolytica TaxID=1749045 RepID=UPI001E63706B|nr:bifunctional nuclease family protein [Gracilimonas amylolytica]
MSKILMEILGLSTSPSSGGAYALILSEVEGNQRLPIIIGSFEAQAIALELENIKPPRPMTHDLLKKFVQNFDSDVKEVYINELKEGTFFAQIILEREDQIIELDSRPSDAIALAVRFGSPIYVDDSVLIEAGIKTEPEQKTIEKALNSDETSPGQKELSQLEKLEAELKTAIETENYEKAAKIRDRISKMKG